MKPPTGPAASLGGTTLTDAGLIALAAGLASGGVLWLGAATSCLITGRAAPSFAPVSALRALADPAVPQSAWDTPVPGPVAYWTATLVVGVAVGALVRVGWRLYRSRMKPTTDRHRNLPGLANPGECEAAAGRRALTRRAGIVRPQLASKPTPADLGYLIGSSRGRELWCAVEDSVLLIGPPRMGKGLHVVIPWILDSPGPVVTTSTRPDTLAATRTHRAAKGPIAIFDPQRLSGLPDGLRWSPIRGCESPKTALVRARGLAAGVGFGNGVSEGSFWSGQTEMALRCLLHAAALAHHRTPRLYEWSLSPERAATAVKALQDNSRAATGWATALASIVNSDARTRDSVWMGVRQALSALADPQVMRAVDPDPGEAFDPEEFLRSCGTLYVLATAVGSASAGPLIAALLEDITETARVMAARSPGARLDPPLLLALDEIANLTPLPSLPALMAEGGGSGITTLTVLQSLSQARNRWGEHAADSIWDAATVKIVLGGLAKMRDLEDIARLLGEIDRPTQTVSRGRSGERSNSVAMRQQPVMPPAMLRTLPFGSAVLLLRQARPAVIDLRPWTARRDAPALRAGQKAVEVAIRDSATAPTAAEGEVGSPPDLPLSWPFRPEDD